MYYSLICIIESLLIFFYVQKNSSDCGRKNVVFDSFHFLYVLSNEWFESVCPEESSDNPFIFYLTNPTTVTVIKKTN